MAKKRYPLELLIRPWSSAMDAIKDSEVSNLVAELGHVLAAFRGVECVGVYCTERAAGLIMNNGSALQVDVDDKGSVSVRITMPPDDCEIEEGTEEHLLIYKDMHENIWARVRLLNARIGRRLRNLFWNGNELYVYWEGQDSILCFRPARNLETGSTVLYWHDTE
ncbi:MAG: hypothetical protein WCK05_07750 [Planctomycetota bacterium]